MSYDFDTDAADTGALSATASLFGAASDASTNPKRFSRLAIWNYIATLLAPVATSGDASHLSVGTLATERLPADVQAIADIPDLPAASSLTGAELIPIIQGGVLERTTSGALARVAITSALPASFEYVIDAAGAPISSRVWGYLEVPFTATITAVQLIADQVGSITVDVWKCTYAQFDAGGTHPVVGDSITAAAPPTISGASKAQDTTLAGWTTLLTQGDILAFSVPSSATNITRVTLSLSLSRVVTP